VSSWTQVLFEAIDDAVFVHDEQGNILEANPAASRRLGYSHDEFLRLNTRDIDEPQFADGFENRLQSQRQTGGTRFEGVHRTKDGRLISVDINTSVIQLDGKPAILAVARDVTAQKQIEKGLHDSRALYESLVQSLPQNILCKDRHGRLTFGNRCYCAMMKRSLPELLGKTDFDLFPEDLANKYVSDDRYVMQTGKTLDTIEAHHSPDGNRLFVHVVKTPAYNAENEIIGVQGIFWDVTQEVLAHEHVIHSEKRYRQLTEATMDGIVVIDPQGKIALFNPAAERMFGYSATELLGTPANILVPEQFTDLHAEGVVNFFRARMGDLLGRPHEVSARRKDGSNFPAEIALSLLTDSKDNAKHDQPMRILAAIRDLTERNKMRAVLVQNEQLASIGLLSAGVAHEINNPLAFVANNLVVLERDCKGLLDVLALYEATRNLDPELASRIRSLAGEIDLDYIKNNLARILSRSREGIDRVTRIVHSLRGLARTDAPLPQDVRIPDLLNGTLEILHGKYKHLGIVVEQQHDPLPVVPCVPTQLSQVVLNLLVNAFQAIEATKRRDGRITIRTARIGAELLLEIKDNGGGIKPEHRVRLFDPFFTTKDVGEGTGLGLSISHHIITAHGGHIEVDSQPGEETCFRVYLPLKQGERPA
jgi:two-component system, NtrC family, sensor kinase